MRNIALVAATGMVLALGTAAGAGDVTDHMNHQQKRIEKGVESGRLTPKEANRLENQQQNIHDERARALEDGKITKGERREIRHDQRKADNAIHHKKHNK